jgi:hypothetical protein
MKTLRLFISSPGDVGREREATRRVIDRLQSEFAEHVTLDPYFWEWEPVDFGHDYQSQIPSTADFDIVICLLWSKLGSRLGDQYKLPPDRTETASSGTQYELMQALHGKQQHPEKLPDLLVWVNKAPPPPASSPPLSRKDEDELIRQRRALQDFLATITRDTSTGIFTAAVNRYEVPSEDLGSYTYLDEFEDMMDKKLRKLIQKHIGERTIKPTPRWPGSPFRDLDVFEFEHAPIFFGRSRAVGEVVRLLQNTLSKPERCHFALILGASGSGKSSLARAGVLPLLTRPGVIEGIGLWRCAIVRPSDDSADLFQALAAALLNAGKEITDKKTDPDFSVSHLFVSNHQPPALPELADPESTNPQQSLAAELRAHPQTVAIRVKDQLNAVAKAHQTQQRHTLEAQIASLTQEGRLADAALKQQAREQLQEPKARIVLLLDQMEELFTLNYAPEQLRAFLETIHVLARSGRVFVIGTLRSDFYPRYQEQPTLVALARDGARFDLLPPTPDEISQIIRRPASLAALQFEPHPTTAEHTLADTLRDEALADTEALPLLEHVLNRLYQAQLPRADGLLTFADYEDICGVDVDPKTHVKTCRGVGGALGKHAEDIFTGQNRQPTDPPPPWTEDTFRAVFRCLVTFGKGEGDTDVPNRRAFTYQDLIQSDPAAQVLVDTFIHERLLIADTDAHSQAIVRLSHEALLTRWPRLAQWLQTAPVRDLMSQRRRLESSLRQWQEQNRTPDCYLQPGFELEEGKQLLEKHEAALKPEERAFIRKSFAYHVTLAEAEAAVKREIAERERHLREKAQRSARRLAVAGAGASCLALLAAWFWWRADQAQSEESKQREIASDLSKAAVHNLALSHRNRGIENAAQQRWVQALAYLSAAVRTDPGNRKMTVPLLFALQFNSWPVPLGVSEWKESNPIQWGDLERAPSNLSIVNESVVIKHVTLEYQFPNPSALVQAATPFTNFLNSYEGTGDEAGLTTGVQEYSSTGRWRGKRFASAHPCAINISDLGWSLATQNEFIDLVPTISAEFPCFFVDLIPSSDLVVALEARPASASFGSVESLYLRHRLFRVGPPPAFGTKLSHEQQRERDHSIPLHINESIELTCRSGKKRKLVNQNSPNGDRIETKLVDSETNEVLFSDLDSSGGLFFGGPLIVPGDRVVIARRDHCSLYDLATGSEVSRIDFEAQYQHATVSVELLRDNQTIAIYIGDSESGDLSFSKIWLMDADSGSVVAVELGGYSECLTSSRKEDWCAWPTKEWGGCAVLVDRESGGKILTLQTTQIGSVTANDSSEVDFDGMRAILEDILDYDSRCPTWVSLLAEAIAGCRIEESGQVIWSNNAHKQILDALNEANGAAFDSPAIKRIYAKFTELLK